MTEGQSHPGNKFDGYIEGDSAADSEAVRLSFAIDSSPCSDFDHMSAANGSRIDSRSWECASLR